MPLKIIPLFLMFFISIATFSQKSTEIYLFNLNIKDNNYSISNPVNISKNEGYDNQPAFTEDGSSILFTSNRDGQTDIAIYDLEFGFRSWLTHTKSNEYSPAPIPNKKKNFSCIRSNEDGSQLLYKYSYKNKEPITLINDLKIAYYIWFNDKTVISYVIDEDVESSLQVSNFKQKIRYPVQQKIGRSFQKIPNTELISFISKSHESPEIYSLNPINSNITYITDPIKGSEDMTWTIDGSLLMAKDSNIYKFKPHKDKNWEKISIESDLPLKNITRLVVSPDGTKIAIVVEE